ncbi:reverse transcriptase domain-containing protein [Tanacetum coccineum]
MLSTLGQHLDRIENISNTKIKEASTSASTSQPKRIEIEENPIFIPYSIDTPINLGEQESILKEINEKLLKLNINNINEDEDDITDLEDQFKDNFEINKIKYNTYTPTAEARNYYHRPTPPDMQFEERNTLSQAHYSGTKIYEWNIDGQTEHQISNLLQEMTMAANAYKAHKNTEVQIVQHLIAGFTGTLKGWSDSYLTEAEKWIILNAKKTIVKTENNIQTETQIDDMINTLIFAILKNFVGDPTAYQERNSVILLNLTCRKLSNFRWYKDVFITKVMTRPDCREAYWKERFIAGLPRLFAEKDEIVRDIEETFKTLRKINMKLNPKKCTFGVEEGMFLGYQVNTKGIKICPDKVDAILSLQSPKCLKDVQKLNGKLATLNRFLAKSAEKSLPFFKTLKKCTKKSDFLWTEEAEAAFRQMKEHIAKLPMLTAPEEQEELIIYLAASKEAVSVVLMTEREARQMPIYFVSRALRGPKVNYTSMEKLVLALVHASKRLKRYFQAHPIIVVTDQPIKNILSNPEVAGRMQKWSIQLGEFGIHYRPRVSVKGQVLADFIVERPEEEGQDDSTKEEEPLPAQWTLFTDGSSCVDGCGAGVILTDPEGVEFTYALRFQFEATNNEVEYEALIAGLQIAEKIGVQSLQVNVDSKLVANQVNGTYIAKETDMIKYLEKVKTLASTFRAFSIKQVPRSKNKKADALSKIASTSFAHLSKQVLVEELKEKSIFGSFLSVFGHLSSFLKFCENRRNLKPVVNYTMHVHDQSLGKTLSDVIFLWKEERVRLLVGSPGASTTPIYSPGSSSTPIYSPGSSTPPRYSPGASTPQSYSPGSSRNAECSNCKHLLDKITVLEATMEMYMHPE